jgi:hypothetical protein
MGGGGDPVMASDTGDPSMDGLSIFLLINRKRNRFSIDLLFDILFSMAIHAKKNGSGDPLIAVEIGLTMATPAQLLLRLHDFFIGQSSGKRESGEKSTKGYDE